MTVSPKDGRLILLLSSVLIVIPMVIFPAKLGTELSSGSFTYAIFEIIYYGVIFFIMRPGSSLLQLFQGAGLAFLFRIVIGTIFGVIISVMYNVGLVAALAMGVSRYLPAIILHVAFTPLVIRPFYLAILGESSGDESRRDRHRRQSPRSETGATTAPFRATTTADSGIVAEAIKKAEPRPTIIAEKGTNGFERAVKYLGEHLSVKLAAVVDEEGLTTATFIRGVDVEAWSPMALRFKEVNQEILQRFYEAPELGQLELTYDHEKIFFIKVNQFMLFVLSEREEEDLLGIRLVQAAEIVSKYISERYGKLLSASPEEKYVPST